MDIDRLWCIGKETYVRFYPNPGFRFVWGRREYRWNWFYGWRAGRVR